MSNPDDDKLAFPGEGGRYVVKDGKRIRVEESTRDHPDGNRPRDSEGRALDGITGRPIEPEEPKPAPAPAGVTSIRSRKPAADD